MMLALDKQIFLLIFHRVERFDVGACTPCTA
ncbi:hypothetical protein T4D_2488 [Trichinella pseudospiralis]|uniref:Uncharacterized protein n=1 Tax=Trichinella pseudospiralis TaxID=6337 RepID=A0A0V1DN82_TRIPS|nr:hypothetical protein T4D_5431 [Trichinella pseudospiralis]KRY76046.1 hypothetical protein T4D_7451 [Trichinella pseudospiralis]KRY80184.1 hypothetical protein T4D_2488 [Trichinella pseudospiralis]